MATSSVAGPRVTLPDLMLKWAPCQGHSISSPWIKPSLKGPPLWVHVSSMARIRKLNALFVDKKSTAGLVTRQSREVAVEKQPGHASVRGAELWDVWRRERVRAKRGDRPREMNRMGWGTG